MYTKCALYTKHNRNHRVIHHTLYITIYIMHIICVYRYIYANFQDFETFWEISKIFADIDRESQRTRESNTW